MRGVRAGVYYRHHVSGSDRLAIRHVAAVGNPVFGDVERDIRRMRHFKKTDEDELGAAGHSMLQHRPADYGSGLPRCHPPPGPR